MPLKIYLDENLSSRTLNNLLTRAGFQIHTPLEAELLGRSDGEQLQYARRQGYVLLTRNPSDFLELYQKDPDHSGILAVYQDNDVRKDMSFQEIVQSLKEVLALKLRLHGNFIVLNQYRRRRPFP